MRDDSVNLTVFDEVLEEVQQSGLAGVFWRVVRIREQ